jgi:long-chain fatty acid transport protein
MRKTQLIVALAAIGFAGSAFATNGYFSHGYGMKAKGMGGAATAMTSDTFGGANNPASMVWVGDRIDLGADLFSPRREASMTMPGPATFTSESDSNYFVIPEFGYNKLINPNMSLGVSVYGNGGMNTNYPSHPGLGANLLSGVGPLGVDLMQLIIAPTLSYKLNNQHSLGVAPLLAYQRFRAEGLQAFGLANQGYDDSTGFGVRVGWLGKVTDSVSLGAAYASKTRMSKFDKYAGLFAEQGDFDIPSNWNIGLAVQATPQVKVALDFQRINYSDVKSIANPSSNFFTGGLGTNNGAGFGWSDVDAWKLGVEYQYSKNLTLRAGVNRGDNPISPANVTFNILAPGVVQNHLSLGFTYVTASGGELTMAYTHAFSNDVTGAHLLAGVPGGPPAGTTNTIKMHQDAIGIAYSWKM